MGEVLIMGNDRGCRERGTAEPPDPEQRREASAHWYRFLETECRKDNGLLRFYDRNKSLEVAYSCGLLADCLTAALGGSEALDLFGDSGPIPEQGENTFRFAK